MSDMQERQTAMERQMERLASSSSSSSSSVTSSPPDSFPCSSAQSSPTSSSSAPSATFAASLSASSRALASYGSSCRGPAATTAGSFLAEPESSWAPPLRPGHLNFPKYVLGSQFKSTIAGFMSMMKPTCQAPDTPSSPRMQAPTTSLLPASVSQQPSVDLTQTTLVAILPSGNLLGSFDKPWMIERMASASEAYLPKHDFPLPGYDKFFKNQRKPLLVAADDQFRKLLNYSWVTHHLTISSPLVLQVSAGVDVGCCFVRCVSLVVSCVVCAIAENRRSCVRSIRSGCTRRTCTTRWGSGSRSGTGWVQSG
jgi:hypothetical protein